MNLKLRKKDLDIIQRNTMIHLVKDLMIRTISFQLKTFSMLPNLRKMTMNLKKMRMKVMMKKKNCENLLLN